MSRPPGRPREGGYLCCICTGRHHALMCPITQSTLIAAEELRPHGTLAAAMRERRRGGASAMCVECRVEWNRRQRMWKRARDARVREARAA